MTHARLAKAAGIVALLTIASKMLGFIRETSLAAVFGATAETDSYLVAQTIPTLVLGIVSYALTTTFIPIYTNIRESKGAAASSRFASGLIWSVLACGIVLTVGGELLAEPLVRIVAPGFSLEVMRLTATLSRVMFPMMIFQLISGIVTGILQAHGRFAVSTAGALVQNGAIILSVVVFGRTHGIVAVAAGTLVGAALALVIQLPVLRLTQFRLCYSLDIRDPYLRRLGLLLIPAMIGAGAGQVNMLVDRVLASGLPEGRVAALNYAYRLMQLAPGILGSSIVTVVYPTLASLAAKRDWQRFGDGIAKALSLVHFMLSPVAIGVLVLREPLVKVVYERGAFDGIATEQTAWALLFLSLGIATTTMGVLVRRAFFTLQDTATPMILGFVTVGVNVVLNYVLVGPLEQGGLALATSIASIVGLILGIWALQRKAMGNLPYKRLLGSVGKSALASLVMGLGISVSHRYLASHLSVEGTVGELIRLAMVVGLGCAFYAALSWFLKVPELILIVQNSRTVMRKVLPRRVLAIWKASR